MQSEVAIRERTCFRVCAALPLPAGIATLVDGRARARAGEVPRIPHRGWQGEACMQHGAEQACPRHRQPDQGAWRRGVVAARPRRASPAVSARLGHQSSRQTEFKLQRIRPPNFGVRHIFGFRLGAASSAEFRRQAHFRLKAPS